METPEKDVDIERINEALRVLGEHFDTVHIFATRVEDDGKTFRFQKGAGNWFARFGQVKCWVILSEAEEARAAKDDDEDECV